MLQYHHSIVSDGAGGSLICLPFVTQAGLDALANQFTVQDSDVFIVSYPKSGTNWVRQIVHLLTHDGIQGNLALHEAVPLLEKEASDGKLAARIECPERRCFISHLPYRLMPGVQDGRARYIFVARNPKDCAVSYFHFMASRSDLQYQGSWDEFVGLFMQGQVPYGLWFEHVLAWWRASQPASNILLLTYEDLQKDLAAAVTGIARFIDIPLTPALCATVVTQSSFAAMSANPTVNVASPQAGYSNRNLRKGEVGDWRNHFSLEQNARFDALYQEKMAGTGLNLEFDLERLRKIIAYPLDADADLDAYEQAFQQLVDSAAVQSVFQRMGAVPAEITHPEQTHHNDRNTTASVWAARLTDPPPVSCICLTYGRPELLEEAIYSFLQQDYAGPKELIVLNDYAEQQLEFAHPEVRIINLPTRFRTVGEKMNAVVALASHDLLFVWDDDDIYLPHRLAFSVQHFDPHKGFFKPEHAWIWNNGVVSGPAKHLFHVGSCWSRRLFDAVRGFPAEGTGYDLLFEERLAHHFPGSAEPYAIMPEDIAYLYRWGGTGSYHMSQFGYLKLGGNVGQEEVASYVAQRAHQGEIPHGRILLQPHWKHDYQQLVADYIQSLAANQVQQLFVSTLSGAI